MRLWSINPKYLDRLGLLGVWREGLLAQKVLLGETKGYKNHPQLIRFRETKDPILYIGTYLYYIYLEGKRRGYNFELNKIIKYDENLDKIPVNSGQVKFEFNLLLRKTNERDKEWYEKIKNTKDIEVHPLFYVKEGPIEKWEITENKLKRIIRETVKEYNILKGREARAKILKIDGNKFKVEFEGSFCHTCGVKDWVEDLAYILIAKGYETKLINYIEEDEEKRIGEFKIEI